MSQRVISSLSKICFFLAWGWILPLHAQTICDQAPSAPAMNAAFLTQLQASVQNQEIRLAIFPFQDGSPVDKDDTLQKAFPVLFHDLLQASGKAGVYHPFVIWDVLEKKNFPANRLFSDEDILAVAKEMNATHVLFGMFQKLSGNQIRYFMKLADVSQNQSLGKIIELGSEESNRLFDISVDGAKEIIRRLRLPFPEASWKKFLAKGPSYESFRYYVKGMEKSRFYDDSSLSIAEAWFEKSLALSYEFSKAAVEQARVLLMRAMIQRQMGKDASFLMAEAGQLLPPAPISRSGKKAAPDLNSPHRWMEAFKSFSTGAFSLKNGKASEALLPLQQAVALTPEDGLAHYFLSRAYESLHDGKASAEKSKAIELNPCLN